MDENRHFGNYLDQTPLILSARHTVFNEFNDDTIKINVALASRLRLAIKIHSDIMHETISLTSRNRI